jgi:hypothetical protein
MAAVGNVAVTPFRTRLSHPPTTGTGIAPRTMLPNKARQPLWSRYQRLKGCLAAAHAARISARATGLPASFHFFKHGGGGFAIDGNDGIARFKIGD